MNIFNQMSLTQEEEFLHQKARLNYALNLSIIEFLVSESSNPDEAKKKLALIINKNTDSRSGAMIDKELLNLLK